MVSDALDPGPNGDYPHFPRFADGSPAWADLAPVGYTGTVVRRGVTWTTAVSGKRVGFDQTPRDAAGNPIVVPVKQP